MTGSEITPLYYGDQELRVVMIDGSPWWVLNDVSAVLEFTNPREAARRLDEDDVSLADVIDAVGRTQRTNVVNESGLYELIIRSDKPQAKPFRRWVAHDVLPEIRQTGSYAGNLTKAEMLVHQAQMLVEQERRMAEQERRTVELEHRVDAIAQNTGHLTALGFAKREGLPAHHDYVWRLGMAASRITRAAGEDIGKVHNEMYGEVNSYPEWALSEAAAGMGPNHELAAGGQGREGSQ